jgi:hypothetical protein
MTMSATATATITPFSSTQFLTDFKKTASAIDAPYSEPSIQKALAIFEKCFSEGGVILRTTNRPKDVLNYRFYLRERIDTVSIATKAGYIEAGNPIGKLATCWSALWEGNTQQWCDFHPETGLAKTWIYLKGIRPVDDILNAVEVPDSVRAHGPTFHELGLERVRFLAVDYAGSTMNLYFTAPGPVTEEQAAKYTKLAQCDPPTEQEFRDMKAFLSPKGFAFAVTMKYDTGAITRVAFYALSLPGKDLPSVDERVKKFFEVAPNYDKERTRVVAWSFGVGGKKYMKCESSYTGEFSTLLKDVGAPLSS